MESVTPITEMILVQYQKPTPVKARIQGAIDFLESKVIKKNMVFRTNSVSYRIGYEIL